MNGKKIICTLVPYGVEYGILRINSNVLKNPNMNVLVLNYQNYGTNTLKKITYIWFIRF